MTTAVEPENPRVNGYSGDQAGMLEQIVENIPDMVFVKSADDLRFVRLNRAAEELLGYARAEIVGLRDHDILPKEDADFLAAIDRRVVAERRMIEIEAEFVATRYRGRRVLHTKRIPIFGDDGEARFILGISEDITERYHRELELAVVHEEAERQNRERDATIAVLNGVVETGNLDMLLQPIIDLRSGKLVGAEALARFRLYPPMPPDHWFKRAADVGLQLPLDMIALETALGHLDHVPSHAFLSVNLSPATLVSHELERLLRSYPADRIVLEVTEHSRVDDYERIEEGIGALRRSGVRIAVDDAGAGWSSMQHIVRLRPEMIKLDTELTRGIDVSSTRRALGAAIVAFAAEIGSTVVAEGIETPGELEALRDLGASFGQGYLLGRPHPLPLLEPPT